MLNLQGTFRCVQIIINRYTGCLMLDQMHASPVVCYAKTVNMILLSVHLCVHVHVPIVCFSLCIYIHVPSRPNSHLSLMHTHSHTILQVTSTTGSAGWEGVWEGGRGAAMQFHRLAKVLSGPQFQL